MPIQNIFVTNSPEHCLYVKLPMKKNNSTVFCVSVLWYSSTHVKGKGTVEVRFNVVVGGYTSHPRYSLTAVYRKMTIECYREGHI